MTSSHHNTNGDKQEVAGHGVNLIGPSSTFLFFHPLRRFPDNFISLLHLTHSLSPYNSTYFFDLEESHYVDWTISPLNVNDTSSHHLARNQSSLQLTIDQKARSYPSSHFRFHEHSELWRLPDSLDLRFPPTISQIFASCSSQSASV